MDDTAATVAYLLSVWHARTRHPCALGVYPSPEAAMRSLRPARVRWSDAPPVATPYTHVGASDDVRYGVQPVLCYASDGAT